MVDGSVLLLVDLFYLIKSIILSPFIAIRWCFRKLATY